jgi:hypothetical protein
VLLVPSLRGAEGDGAIQLDCFASLAMTNVAPHIVTVARLFKRSPLC